jgi:small nuclear ribonucleoprotein G
MSKTHPPELKKYMDKHVSIKINGGRVVEGILRGFDPFMNIVSGVCSLLTDVCARRWSTKRSN